MAKVVTINRPEVVALIEEAGQRLTGGNKTEAVALAMRRLLDQNARPGCLFGAHPGSVRVHEAVDLTAPAPDVEPRTETCRRLNPKQSVGLLCIHNDCIGRSVLIGHKSPSPCHGLRMTMCGRFSHLRISPQP
jgi:hypothetical protein